MDDDHAHDDENVTLHMDGYKTINSEISYSFSNDDAFVDIKMDKIMGMTSLKCTQRPIQITFML